MKPSLIIMRAGECRTPTRSGSRRQGRQESDQSCRAEARSPEYWEKVLVCPRRLYDHWCAVHPGGRCKAGRLKRTTDRIKPGKQLDFHMEGPHMRRKRQHLVTVIVALSLFLGTVLQAG